MNLIHFKKVEMTSIHFCQQQENSRDVFSFPQCTEMISAVLLLLDEKTAHRDEQQRFFFIFFDV
jgi:hypothetical protein